MTIFFPSRCAYEGFFSKRLEFKPSSINAQLACQRLKDFFSQGSDSVVAKLRGECKTEKEFNCIVATKVLIPLSSGHCLINKKTPDVKDKRLKLPSEGGVKGLVIGEKILLPSSNKLRHFIISLPELTWLLFSTNTLHLQCSWPKRNEIGCYKTTARVAKKRTEWYCFP